MPHCASPRLLACFLFLIWFHATLALNGAVPPAQVWNKKDSTWDPVQPAAAGKSSRDSLDNFAAAANASAGSSSGGKPANPHAETAWQGWDASGAKDAYLSTRKMAASNRYQTDTPYWSRPEWMRRKN